MCSWRRGDFTFPAYPDLSGQTTGATANFISRRLGATYMEAMQARDRAGRLATCSTTGCYTARALRLDPESADAEQTSSGTTDAPFVSRTGWSLRRRRGSADRELTAKLEYLYSNFGAKNVGFRTTTKFSARFRLQTVRLGLNYILATE